MGRKPPKDEPPDLGAPPESERPPMDSSAWLPPDICRWAETPTTSVPPLDCGISAVTPPELMDALCENSLPQLETSTATGITRMSIKVTRRRPARKLNI